MISLSGEFGSSISPMGTPSASSSTTGSRLGVLTTSGGPLNPGVIVGITRMVDDAGRNWLKLRPIMGSGGGAKTGESGGGGIDIAEDSAIGSAVEIGCGEAVHLYP